MRYYGTNPENGNPVYYKADGSLVQGNLPGSSYSVFDPANPADVSQAASLSAADDRVILGQSLPKYFGGLNSSMNCKNFSLKKAKSKLPLVMQRQLLKPTILF